MRAGWGSLGSARGAAIFCERSEPTSNEKLAATRSLSPRRASQARQGGWGGGGGSNFFVSLLAEWCSKTCFPGS